MINLLATGLISLCLLSPVQSPDCAGDIGVSTPFVSVQVPHHLPPIPLPPGLGGPLPVPHPVHPPFPLPGPPVPPVHPPHPVTGPDTPAPELPAIPAAPAPEQAVPAQPVPVVPSKPTPVFTPAPPTLQQIAESTPIPEPVPVAPVPAAQTMPNHYRPPFGDGSFGAAIGNTVAQFPDLLGIFTVLLGLGIIAIVERLDESPKFPNLFRKKAIANK